MEHMILPNSADVLDIGSTPVVSSRPNDGLGFEKYAVQLGIPSFELMGRLPRVGVNPKRNYLQSMSVEDLQSFYQNWLYFSLIHDVLGNDFSLDDFSSHDAAGRPILSTTRLVPCLEAWIEATHQREPKSRKRYEYIAKCLSVTHMMLVAAPPGLGDEIKAQLASVAELLGYATSKAFDVAWTNNAEESSMPGSWHKIVSTSFWDARLRDKGWCPSQIKSIHDTFQTLQSLYFISYCYGPMSELVHDECNEGECVAIRVDAERRQCQHVCKDLGCGMMSISQPALYKCLEEGRLPLIRIYDSEGLSQLSADIVPWEKETMSYVALSHVWADGLGNSKFCGLPRCQLRYLKNMLIDLGGQGRGPDQPPSRDLLFWCDTLCCPVEPEEAKNLALKEMYNVYDQAEFVLVLDKSLTPFSYKDMDVYESCARISLAPWMRRLWTLQEGALPARHKRLWFQFSDRAVNVEELHPRSREDFQSSISSKGLTRDMLSALSSFYNLFTKDKDLRGADLGTITTALAHRSVTVPSDEPLLIATLLGLDLEKMVDVDPGMRMQQLWRLMPTATRGIPKDILFRSGPKLTERGFRWAPSTLLQGHYSWLMNVSGREEDMGFLDNVAVGLRVCLPGFRVESAQPVRNFPDSSSHLSSSKNKETLYMGDGDGSWYMLKTMYPTSIKGSPKGSTISATLSDLRNVCILHPRPNFPSTDPRVGAWQGILVEIDPPYQNIINARIISHVQFGLFSGNGQGLLKSAHRLAQHFGLLGDHDSLESDPSSKFDTELQRLATSEPALCALAEGGRDGSKTSIDLMRDFIKKFVTGAYVEIRERMPESQQWCVD